MNPIPPTAALPCPFCGEDATIRNNGLLGCSSIQCIATLMHARPQDWNRRAPAVQATADADEEIDAIAYEASQAANSTAKLTDHMRAQIAGWASRLKALRKAVSPKAAASGEADGVFISVDDYHPNPAHELAIHRNDCGIFQAFYSKHAGGGLGPKSCLICGKSMIEQAVGIQHMELEDIVVCSTCTRLARIPDGEPFGHIHLHALSWVTHEHWLKMSKMEQEWYPIPIGKFVDTGPIASAAVSGDKQEKER